MIKIKISAVCFLLSLFVAGFGQGQQNYKDELGRKQGFWKSYDEMGHLKYEGTFKDDIPVGIFRYYYPDGVIRAISEIFNNGTQSHTKLFHPNSKLMAEGNYLNKKKDSIWKYYSEYDGVLLTEENYKNYQKEGLWQKFYPNGQVAEKITYFNDREEGEWIQYYTDGIKKLEGFYHNGLKEGEFRTYYQNGKVETSGTYANSLKEGVWTHYSEDGKVVRTENFKHDRLVPGKE